MLERLSLCAILRSNVNTELQDVSLMYVSKVFTLLFVTLSKLLIILVFYIHFFKKNLKCQPQHKVSLTIFYIQLNLNCQ